jgi:hypothetical protein
MIYKEEKTMKKRPEILEEAYNLDYAAFAARLCGKQLTPEQEAAADAVDAHYDKVQEWKEGKKWQ